MKVGSSLLCRLFSSCRAWLSHYRGFFCCGTRLQGTWASVTEAHRLSSYSFKALEVKVKSLSRARLFVTPWTAAYQAPPPVGFSRQEDWSGLPFPSPMQKSESEVTPSSPTTSHPMDCSLPGSSTRGIFQARVLEWVAIAFSDSGMT